MTSNFAINPGLNSFKDFFIDSNGTFQDQVYYVDKTRFIEKVYKHNAVVTLFTRPRRFGKSMFLSMLKTFFEPNSQNPNDLTIHEQIFSQFEIYKNHEFCEKNMGKHPVLFISFATAGSEINYDDAIKDLCSVISSYAEKYEFLLQSDKLSDRDKDNLSIVCDLFKSKEPLEDKITLLKMSLILLCNAIYKHYGKKVIVLIDEYDVPLAHAAPTDYYYKIKDIISKMLEKVLKGNEQLDKAFLTGCLKIAKESIFTGFNNFRVVDYDNINFSSLFGFTENEVKKILKNFNLEEHFEEYKAWYDGYLFGNDEIYCPWDVLNYTSDLIENPNSHPQAYWNNSSENRLAMYAFDNNPNDYAEEFRTLLDGKSIVAPYYESMNYKMIMNVDSNDENYLWTILYMTGYLTKDKNQEGVEEGNVRLRIPNICVKACLEDQIKWTFSMKNPMFKMLSLEYIECFKNDDYGEFQALLNDSLMAYVSIYDTQKGTDKEALYHAYLNGALSTSLKNLRAKYKSNNELGIGRPDIRFILKNPKLRENKCVIIECKVTEKEENLSHYAELAIEQIKEKYFNGIKPSFPNVNCIAMYGIAFYKKTCMINFKKIPI